MGMPAEDPCSAVAASGSATELSGGPVVSDNTPPRAAFTSCMGIGSQRPPHLQLRGRARLARRPLEFAAALGTCRAGL